jgi:hypothetical protein
LASNPSLPCGDCFASLSRLYDGDELCCVLLFYS